MESRGGFLALHYAVGRARLCRCLSDDEFLRAEVELLWDEQEEIVDPADALSAELSELTRLQKRHGLKAAGLQGALALAKPLPPELQAVQGLWRARSGVRIRIDGDEIQDLGSLEVGQDGRLVVQLGSKPFAATPAGATDAYVDSLTWDDGDVWERLAAPPPIRCSQPAASIWQAARRWRALGTWRAEARRGEARWSSATELAKSNARPWDPEGDGEGAIAWASAAQKADSAARAELWEDTLRPCQQLLQAPTSAARVEIFRGMLRAELTRLQLLLAVEPGEDKKACVPHWTCLWKHIAFAKVMRTFQELRLLMHSIISCIRSLIWVVAVLCLMLGMFSVMFTSAVGSTLDTTALRKLNRENELLLAHFGTLDRSILNLYMSMTGGTDWSVQYEVTSLHVQCRQKHLQSLAASTCIFEACDPRTFLRPWHRYRPSTWPCSSCISRSASMH